MKSFSESEGIIKYTSSTLQNEVIESCNQIILNKVQTILNSQKCFIILADETADINGIEQVCAHHLNVENMILKEEFFQLVPTTDATEKSRTDIILRILHSFGIEIKYLGGLGYDRCASTPGNFNGVRAKNRQSHPHLQLMF